MYEIEKQLFNINYSGWDGYYCYYENARFEDLSNIIENIHKENGSAVVNVVGTTCYYNSTTFNGRLCLQQSSRPDNRFPAYFFL